MKIKKLLEETIIRFCYLLNIVIPKNKREVFFYSIPDYSDNAREIYEEIKRQSLDKKYKIVWAVRDVEKYSAIISNATVVKHRSIKNLFFYCRAHYIFRTHSLWGNLYVNKRQKMFVAWHGMPLKSLMRGNPRPYRCDYINLTSDFFKNELYSAVAMPLNNNPNTGLARNDLLLKPNNILRDFGYSKYNQLYLWMPTFRNPINACYKDGIEGEAGIPLLSIEDLSILNTILQSKNELLILKLHPWSADKISGVSFSNIVNLKDEDILPPYSLYSLVGKVDILITDYSSVYIDYLLTDKPIWFVYDDIDEYRRTRGFAFEPAEDYLPGIKISTREELFSCFKGGYNDEQYSKDRLRIKSIFHQYCDDKSAKRILDIMEIE